MFYLYWLLKKQLSHCPRFLHWDISRYPTPFEAFNFLLNFKKTDSRFCRFLYWDISRYPTPFEAFNFLLNFKKMDSRFCKIFCFVPYVIIIWGLLYFVFSIDIIQKCSNMFLHSSQNNNEEKGYVILVHGFSMMKAKCMSLRLVRSLAISYWKWFRFYQKSISI